MAPQLTHKKKKHKERKNFFVNNKMIILLNQKHDRSHHTFFHNKDLSIYPLNRKKNRGSHASFLISVQIPYVFLTGSTLSKWSSVKKVLPEIEHFHPRK